MKRSAFGGGIKAGGRNYVSCFVNIAENAEYKAKEIKETAYKSFASMLNVKENARFQVAVESYLKNWKHEFSLELDINNLLGERNTFRYLPLKSMALRVQATDELSDLFMILAAADIVGTRITMSIAPEDYKLEVLKNCINKECDILIQSEAEFLEEMDDYERIRTCSFDISKEMILKAAQLGKYIATAKPIIEGRVELLHYVKEQSIAFEYHRYGSITETAETKD